MADRAGRGSREAGFTLIEAVTALGVFSIAAIALLNIGGQNARALAVVEARAFARIVAHNELVSAVAATERPVIGRRSGATRLAGRSWTWVRTVAPMSDPEIVSITVTVREGEEGAEGPVAAETTAFWGGK
ncbi:MAG: type II secretion system minor pseudopilin GspI [Caulobacterales bacterium]|nr:type II secretion system minor pseudopilin GspI [Caulobacterales bacterium]